MAESTSTTRQPELNPQLRLLQLPVGHFEYVTTHAIASAPVAGDQPSYPVLIYLEGLIGYRQMNTFQVEEMVSHGYIVAAIDQPYVAARVVFPDGRQADYDDRFDPPHRQPGYDPNTFPAHSAFYFDRISYLAQDALFTLDQLAALNQANPNGILTGRLDLQRAGLFGHSGAPSSVAKPACCSRACGPACWKMPTCTLTWYASACSSQPCSSPAMSKPYGSNAGSPAVGQRQPSRKL
jgi:hypothetical protein